MTCQTAGVTLTDRTAAGVETNEEKLKTTLLLVVCAEATAKAAKKRHNADSFLIYIKELQSKHYRPARTSMYS